MSSQQWSDAQRTQLLYHVCVTKPARRPVPSVLEAATMLMQLSLNVQAAAFRWEWVDRPEPGTLLFIFHGSQTTPAAPLPLDGIRYTGNESISRAQTTLNGQNGSFAVTLEFYEHRQGFLPPTTADSPVPPNERYLNRTRRRWRLIQGGASPALWVIYWGADEGPAEPCPPGWESQPIRQYPLVPVNLSEPPHSIVPYLRSLGPGGFTQPTPVQPPQGTGGAPGPGLNAVASPGMSHAQQAPPLPGAGLQGLGSNMAQNPLMSMPPQQILSMYNQAQAAGQPPTPQLAQAVAVVRQQLMQAQAQQHASTAAVVAGAGGGGPGTPGPISVAGRLAAAANAAGGAAPPGTPQQGQLMGQGGIRPLHLGGGTPISNLAQTQATQAQVQARMAAAAAGSGQKPPPMQPLGGGPGPMTSPLKPVGGLPGVGSQSYTNAQLGPGGRPTTSSSAVALGRPPAISGPGRSLHNLEGQSNEPPQGPNPLAGLMTSDPLDAYTTKLAAVERFRRNHRDLGAVFSAWTVKELLEEANKPSKTNGRDGYKESMGLTGGTDGDSAEDAMKRRIKELEQETKDMERAYLATVERVKRPLHALAEPADPTVAHAAGELSQSPSGAESDKADVQIQSPINTA